jgi:hypothetical protein
MAVGTRAVDGNYSKKYLIVKLRSVRMDKLEVAYTVDLLARLTESIETYLDDDRWDGIKVMHDEIKESNKLIKKYYKRIKEKEDESNR